MWAAAGALVWRHRWMLMRYSAFAESVRGEHMGDMRYRVVFFGIGISMALWLFLCILGLILTGTFAAGWFLK
jgi:hypothetical protein